MLELGFSVCVPAPEFTLFDEVSTFLSATLSLRLLVEWYIENPIKPTVTITKLIFRELSLRYKQF